MDIRIRETAFHVGGKFYGKDPKDIVFIVGHKTNSNQGFSDFHQTLRLTTNTTRLTKQEFGTLGVAPRLELANLNQQGIIYVKVNERVLNTFEIGNFTYNTIRKITASQDLSVDELNLSTQIPIMFNLDKVLVSFTGNVNETITTSYITSEGDEIVLDSQTLAAASVYTYISDGLKVAELDQIKVNCTDVGGAETATAYIFAEIRWDGQ